MTSRDDTGACDGERSNNRVLQEVQIDGTVCNFTGFGTAANSLLPLLLLPPVLVLLPRSLAPLSPRPLPPMPLPTPSEPRRTTLLFCVLMLTCKMPVTGGVVILADTACGL